MKTSPKDKERKCPVCNTGVHFAGKIMEYEDGILVENNCRRCGGTGFLPNKPTTLRELREKWLDFWHKESQHCEQKYLTPDTHGIIIDFLTSHNTELLRKIEGLKNSKKMRERSLISPLESYRIDDQEYGFNQALDDILALLEDNKK